MSTESVIKSLTDPPQPVLTDDLEHRIYSDGYKDAMQNVRMMIVKLERHYGMNGFVELAAEFAAKLRRAIDEDLSEL